MAVCLPPKMGQLQCCEKTRSFDVAEVAVSRDDLKIAAEVADSRDDQLVRSDETSNGATAPGALVALAAPATDAPIAAVAIGSATTEQPRLAMNGHPQASYDPSLTPALQQMQEMWAALIQEMGNGPPQSRGRSSRKSFFSTISIPLGGSVDPINWEVDGSEVHLRILQEMNTLYDLNRFLQARDNDPQKGFTLMKKGALYLAAIDPANTIKDNISIPQSQNVYYWAGYTKCGYPIVVAKLGQWVPSAYDLDAHIRWLTYLNYMGTFHAGPGVKRAIVIYSTELSLELVRPTATQMVLTSLKIAQEVFPERFAAFFVLNCNAIFRSLWPWVNSLLEPGIRPLVHFVPTEQQREVLGKFIDVAVLEEGFGGDYTGSYPGMTGEFAKDALVEDAPQYDPSQPDPLRDPVL